MISIDDIEQAALKKLPKPVADYFQGGSGQEKTLAQNINAFDDIQLLPRVLRGNFEDSLDLALPGCEIQIPIIVAPTAFHRLAHSDGEMATARAAARANSLMVVSMASNTDVKEIAQAARSINLEAPLWMQIYIQPDRAFTLSRIRKAENAGCVGLVVTVDSPVFGVRARDIRNGFTDLPEGFTCANMQDSDGVIRNIEFDSSLTWESIAWLREQTKLPIILKGILHPQDISLAIQYGAQAVMVSNHGGRQLDGVPATVQLLPRLANAAAGQVPLILDGGVRTGTDVLKALALGATAIAVGRPVIWGLAVNGEDGVFDVLSHLHHELLAAVKLSGCRTQKDFNSELLFNDGGI